MKISIQTESLVSDFGKREAYKMIKEAGFEAIDWNINTTWSYPELLSAKELRGLSVFEKTLPEVLNHYDEELFEIRKNGLSISQAHAPFNPYDMARPEILDYAIPIYKRMIEFCSVVGCPNLIVHGISTRDLASLDAEECYRLNLKLYESLIPTLREVKNVTVCLENLFARHNNGFCDGICSVAQEAARLVDLLNEKAGERYFAFCLDTGHLNLLRNDPVYFARTMGKRIVSLHIHDNRADNDFHMMPYTGSLDWKRFIEAMRSIGYDGDLSFETFAQTATSYVPRELVPTFLKTIYEIGNYFRKEIISATNK